MTPRIVTKNFDVDRAWEIGVYESAGGYGAAKKIFGQVPPEKLIDEMKAANLRGRGGAGFPAGVKWGFLPKDGAKPIYLVVNADEGEPGTFKDRSLMELDPHLLVEGCLLTCWAIKAHTAYIYIRGELKRAWERVQGAIDQARAKGYVGGRPFGQEWSVEIHTHRGAGAYICGEETALLNSLEGRRGEPRLKPPFPAISGAFGAPTIINNVETIMVVPWILENGGKAFDALGVPEQKDGGVRVYGVSGMVKNPGLFELPVGITLRDLVFNHAGGPLDGRTITGIIPGGSSCPVLVPSEFDIRMTVDSLKTVGSMLGTCGAIVLDDSICPVAAAENLMSFYHHESCGQCTPCREGTGWMEKLVHKIESGAGTTNDVETLASVANNIMGNTICAFGDGAAMPMVGFVKKFRADFDRHVLLKRCPWEAR